jgi:hypothetical protein
MSPSNRQKQRLRAHFAFTKIPFHKPMWAKHMYDSASQRELRHALQMWTDLHGLVVVVGSSGVHSFEGTGCYRQIVISNG